MGDENPIRTLEDYSKPSHEGYRNTIKLLVGNNVVPLRFDTIQLVQNGCSFHGLQSEDPNQHLKDFLKLVDSLDLDGENRERTRMRLFQFSLRDQASNWLEHLPAGSITTWEVITEEFIEFSLEVARRLKERIKENDNRPKKIKKIIKYPDTKVLENSAKHNFLENLEKKTFPTPVNLLCVRYFRLIPSNPSRPLKNTFRFKPGKRANQSHHNPSNSLTIQLPTQSDPTFVDDDPIKRDPSPHFSFTHGMSKRARNTRGQASSSREETMEEKVLLSHSSTLSTPIPSLDHNGYEPLHKGVTFRLGGVEKEMSLLEFGWRVDLYAERESRDGATLNGLGRAEMVNYTHLTHLFWPSIGDDGFNVGNTKAKSIRDPRIKLAHRCITMTITGRKETTNRVTEIDLFYLYCIYREGIAWSFGFLTEEMISVLNREPPPHIYRKKSLVKMGIIMELHEGECCWSATRGVVEEDKGDDEEGDVQGGNEGVGGSVDIYRNMSAGD
ncbi:hypothetical protein Tco_1569656 [Tanacetum coccineum]